MYYYKIGVLKAIAQGYRMLDDGLSFKENREIYNARSISEFRCDFEMAFSSLGRKFNGTKGRRFKDFRNYPLLQRAVLADIFDIGWWDLRKTGDIELLSLRKEAYRQMCDYLNGRKTINETLK